MQSSNKDEMRIRQEERERERERDEGPANERSENETVTIDRVGSSNCVSKLSNRQAVDCNALFQINAKITRGEKEERHQR